MKLFNPFLHISLKSKSLIQNSFDSLDFLNCIFLRYKFRQSQTHIKMIQKNGDYYIYEANPGPQKVIQSNNLDTEPIQQKHHATGNVKQKIQLIRQRFESIKRLKKQFELKQQSKSADCIFQRIKKQANDCQNLVDIELFIPEQILRLDQKISHIEGKINPNEIFRRKMQNKGPLVQRIKLLHQKLQKVLKKSSELIIGNIQSYCASLDDKEQYLKIMFLKQAQSKTKGVKEQILVLEGYLKNLNLIQTKVKAMEPLDKVITTHGQIMGLRAQLSKKISELFKSMKQSYQQILQDIDSIIV